MVLSNSDTSIASSSYPVTVTPQTMKFKNISTKTRNAFMDVAFPLKTKPSLMQIVNLSDTIAIPLIIGSGIYLAFALFKPFSVDLIVPLILLWFGLIAEYSLNKSDKFSSANAKYLDSVNARKAKDKAIKKDHNLVPRSLFSIPYEDNLKEIYEKLSFKQVIKGVKHIVKKPTRDYRSQDIIGKVKEYWNHFDPNVKAIFKNGFNVYSYVNNAFSFFTKYEEDMKNEDICNFYESLRTKIPHYKKTMKVVKALKASPFY